MSPYVAGSSAYPLTTLRKHFPGLPVALTALSYEWIARPGLASSEQHVSSVRAGLSIQLLIAWAGHLVVRHFEFSTSVLQMRGGCELAALAQLQGTPSSC